MDYFFGFDTKLASKVDWFFNANHLFLLLWVAGFIVACCFLFSAKSEKGKKVTKLVLAGILFVLESWQNGLQVSVTSSQWWHCKQF